MFLWNQGAKDTSDVNESTLEANFWDYDDVCREIWTSLKKSNSAVLSAVTAKRNEMKGLWQAQTISNKLKESRQFWPKYEMPNKIYFRKTHFVTLIKQLNVLMNSNDS